MTKYLYDYLCHVFMDSARKELRLVKDEYPTLSEDVRKWTYQGKTMSDYEVLRQQYVEQIEQTKDAQKKERLRLEGADILMHAGRWYAFQLLFEEAYKEQFAREVIINMLRCGKFSADDIEHILPYVNKKQIENIEQMLKAGIDDWEVLCDA